MNRLRAVFHYLEISIKNYAYNDFFIFSIAV